MAQPIGNIIRVQWRDTRNNTPEEMIRNCAGLVSTFSAHSAFNNDSYLHALFDLAGQHDMRRQRWIFPGLPWPGMAAQHNLKNYYGSEDWVAFHRSATRTACYNWWTTNVLDPLVSAGRIEEVGLDYQRYLGGYTKEVGGYSGLSEDDVTAVIQMFKTYCDTNGLVCSHAVRRGETRWSGGTPYPGFQWIGQRWDSWLADGDLDNVHIRSFQLLRETDDPATIWANQPTTDLDKQNAFFGPGGTGSRASFTRNEVRILEQFAQDWGYALYTRPSWFDYRNIESGKTDGVSRWTYLRHVENLAGTF